MLIATVSAGVAAMLIISTIVVGYFMISNRRQPAQSGQVVNYFHHQSSVTGKNCWDMSLLLLKFIERSKPKPINFVVVHSFDVFYPLILPFD